MEELKEEIILIRGRKRTTTLAIIVNSSCSGLDVCVQTRFTGCPPTAQDGAFRGGASETRSGHDGGAPVNGLHALTKEAPQISLPLRLCEDTREVGHPKSTLIPPHGHPDPTPPASGVVSDQFLWF